jgi:hypothetical protein
MATWYEDYESGANIARARTDRALQLKRDEEDRVYQAEIRKNQLQKLKEAQEQADLIKAKQTDQFNLARSLQIGANPLPVAGVVAEGPAGQYVTDTSTTSEIDEIADAPAGLAEVYTTPGAYEKLETDYTTAVTERDTTYEEAYAALKAKQAEVEELGGVEALEKKIAELEGEAKKLAEGPTGKGLDANKVGSQILNEQGLRGKPYQNKLGPTEQGIRKWEEKTGKVFADELKKRMASGVTITDDAQTAHDKAVTENTDFLTEYKTLLEAASGDKEDMLKKYKADLKKLKEEKDKATDKLDLAEIARLEEEIKGNYVHRLLNRNQFGRDIKKILLERDSLVAQFETYSSGDAPDLEKALIIQNDIAILDSQLWVEMLEQGITDIVLGKSPEIIESVMSEFLGATVRIQKRDDKGDKGKPRWHIYADGKLLKSPTNEMYWSQAQLETETQREVSDAFDATVRAAEAALNEKLLEGMVTEADLLEHTMTYLGVIADLQSKEFIERMKSQTLIKYSTPDANNNMIINVGGKFFRYLADPASHADAEGNKPKQLTEITDLSEAAELNLLKAMASGASTESAEAIISKVAGLQ